jgi:hypothetical protein
VVEKILQKLSPEDADVVRKYIRDLELECEQLQLEAERPRKKRRRFDEE